MSAQMYRLLADLTLIVHVAFVAFIVLGLIAVWVGYFCRWKFVRNIWFRIIHLGAMGYVVIGVLTNRPCPLTIWEDELRLAAGEAERYAGSFIQHWLHRILFFDASENFFRVLYVLVFLAIVGSWIFVPPRLNRKKSALESDARDG